MAPRSTTRPAAPSGDTAPAAAPRALRSAGRATDPTAVAPDRGRSRPGSRLPTPQGSRAPSRGPVAAPQPTARSNPRSRRTRLTLTAELELENFGALDGDGDSDNPDEPDLSSLRAELRSRMRTWTAPVYQLYEVPDVLFRNGVLFHEFKCKKCTDSVFRSQETTDITSTSLLLKHARRQHPVELDAAIAAKSSAETIPRRPYTDNEIRIELVVWIAESMRPMSIVEDAGFRRLMMAGRPNMWVPSRTTLARDLATIYRQASQQIAAMLQGLPGRIHVTSDAWTSPNHLAFVAFIAHFISAGALKHVLLDIVDLSESHTGAALAKLLHSVLRRFDIADKLMCVTLDNATNNTVLVQKLQRLLPQSFSGRHSHGNCLAHITNLAAKATLSAFERKASSSDDDDDDEEEDYLTDFDPENDFIDDADSEGEEDAFEQGMPSLDEDGESEVDPDESDKEEDQETLKQQAAIISAILAKIRKLAVKISRSTTKLRPLWVEKMKMFDLPLRRFPRDVATRWNSTYVLLQFALRFKQAINAMTVSVDELRCLTLSDGEWNLLQQLKTIMEAFNVLTQFFSRADLPATCYALRSLNNLVVRISDEAANSSSAAIRAAAQLGCAKIRKYLRILKEKELYQFSAVFNPSIKKTFFESRPAQYPASWLNGVLARMDEVFRTCYLAGDESPSAGVQAEPMTFEDEMFGLSPVKTSNTAPGARGRGARGGVRAEHTAFAAELEHYLATPRDKTSDVISWWLAHRGTYPNLHRMALDYVSAPGTTIEVERLFSTGRILLSHLRNRMSEESVHSILSLRSWFGTNFLDKRDFDLGPSQ